MPQTRWTTATILNGEATSNALDVVFGERLVAVETPAAWTAADVVIQVSRDGTNYLDLKDIIGTIIRITNVGLAAAECRIVANDLTAIDLPLGPHKIRLRSCNTANANNVNQGADRVLYVALERD